MANDCIRFHVTPLDITCRNWKEYKLIMPTVSVGQVGQLAIDLLLNNLGGKCKKIGVIYTDAILPIVGRDTNGNGFCMGLEVYANEEDKIVVIQQRAPFVKGRIPSFRRYLVSWIKKSCFAEVVICSGVSSHIRKDAELSGSLFRFLTTEEDMIEKFSQEYKWQEYTIKTSDEISSFQMPGSGILKSMYEDCKKENIAFCGFMVFCSPGNTIRESMLLFEQLMKGIEISTDTQKLFKMPHSWNQLGDELPSNYIF